MMTKDEKTLIYLIGTVSDSNVQAILLQIFIAKQGPLSEEAGAKVKELLKPKNAMKKDRKGRLDEAIEANARYQRAKHLSENRSTETDENNKIIPPEQKTNGETTDRTER